MGTVATSGFDTLGRPVRFETRTCDRCDRRSAPLPADDLEQLHGWERHDGVDLCAHCVWDLECEVADA